ncbi:MAG: hypothetical protein ACO1NY_02600, partial [Pseudorhodoplanes sp.]
TSGEQPRRSPARERKGSHAVADNGHVRDTDARTTPLTPPGSTDPALKDALARLGAAIKGK